VTPSVESRQLGLILAGLDQEANTLGASDFALTDALATDLSDGNLDGQDGGTPILINQSTPLPPDATTTNLQNAMNTFAGSTNNQTNAPPPQVSPTPTSIDAATTPPVGISVTESELSCGSAIPGTKVIKGYVAKFEATGPVGTTAFPPLGIANQQVLDWTGISSGLRYRTPADPPNTLITLGYPGNISDQLDISVQLWPPGQLNPTSFPFHIACLGGSQGSVGGRPAPRTTQWSLTFIGSASVPEPGTCLPNGACTFQFSEGAGGLSITYTINAQFSGPLVHLSGTGTLSGSVNGATAAGSYIVTGDGQADAAYPAATHADGTATEAGSGSVATPGGNSSGSVSGQWTMSRTG